MSRRTRLVAGGVALLLTGAVSSAPTAAAEIVADGAAAAGVAQCNTLFSTPGNDPAGLWSRLNTPGGPRVVIKWLPTPPDGKGTRTGVLDNGDIRIFWDHTHDVTIDGITAGPCEVLYHELQHAADDADNVPDQTQDETCNGIPRAEWRAVGAENALRRALGLPDQRQSYHGTPFGAGSFDECTKNQKPTPPPKKTAGNGVFGDPHVATTDGLLYDLQQVGEFTAFTSDDADAPRVQLRTAPVADSRFASLVSGAAAGTGDQRIAFVLDGGALTITHGPGQQPTTVAPDTQQDLGGGMVLAAVPPDDSYVDSSWTVRWADGSQLDVDVTGYWGLRVAFDPSPAARTAHPRGLLGTFDGDAANDLTRPDGRVVPSGSDAAGVRSRFGDAWRIRQADSLFPYAPGQSTTTYTDLTFPAAEPAFPAAVTDRARQVCRDAGVDVEAVLAACAFDVAVTGEPSLASAAARTARETSVVAVAGAPPDGAIFGPGRTVGGTVEATRPISYEFTARAGEVADVRSACTSAGRGVGYTVVAVDGAIGDPLGIADACSDIGRVAFAADGRYRLDVTGGGRYAITWRTTPGDQRRALVPGDDAGHLAAATRHSLDFTVAPGQRWTFTPDAGCTPVPGFVWSIVDAGGALNDRGIDDGCRPIGPVTLAPGRYDLRLEAHASDADYLFTATTG